MCPSELRMATLLSTCREWWTIMMFTSGPDTVAHGKTLRTPSTHSAMANCSALWLPPSILMRAYRTHSLLSACSVKHMYKHITHMQAWAWMPPRRRNKTQRGERRCEPCVSLWQGNWKVFIWLMDMKRRGETRGRSNGGGQEKEGGALNYNTTNSL